MRAADLLGADVHGPDGRRLGEVLDIRLVQDGPSLGGERALRIHGLVVGTRRTASHLGYDRAGVRGPALVAAITRRLAAGNRYLPWVEVAELTAGTVHSAVTHLIPVPDLVDQP
jgi:hypothetical protein